MDLSIPLILILLVGGNAIFFAGFFEFAREYVFPETQQEQRLEQQEAETEDETETELKELERELRRM